MAEKTRSPLLEHEPTGAPVFRPANLAAGRFSDVVGRKRLLAGGCGTEASDRRLDIFEEEP